MFINMNSITTDKVLLNSYLNNVHSPPNFNFSVGVPA